MTAGRFSECLKEAWTEDNFKKAFQMDMDDLLRDHQRAMQRQVFTIPQNQVRFTGNEGLYPGGSYVQVPMNLDISPAAVRNRNQRQQLMLQQYAAAKRKGKPSYRQRQKNARLARDGRKIKATVVR